MTECAPLRQSFSAFARLSTPDEDRNHAVDCRLAFLHDAVDTSTPIPFQLALSSLPTSRFAGLAFSRLEITFNDDRPPYVVEHRDPSAAAADVREVVNLGEAGSSGEKSANLAWRDGGETKLFLGSIKVDKEIDLTVRRQVRSRTHNSSLPTAIAGREGRPLCVGRQLDCRPQRAAEPPQRTGRARVVH